MNKLLYQTEDSRDNERQAVGGETRTSVIEIDQMDKSMTSNDR